MMFLHQDREKKTCSECDVIGIVMNYDTKQYLEG